MVLKSFEYLRGALVPMVKAGTTITLHSEHTQMLIEKEDVILWNMEASTMDSTAYDELCSSIRRSNTKYYSASTKLSYPDFCIALVCCVSYSLNHNVVEGLQHRAFTSAWRLLQSLSIAGGDNISGWLKKNIDGRSSMGYASMLGVEIEGATTARRKFRNVKDETLSDFLSDITLDNKAVRLGDEAGFDRWSLVPEDELRILNVEMMLRKKEDEKQEL